MAIMQNSFANTSSSILISKVQGNIVDVLMPPLSEYELTFSYLLGGITRGLLVGLSVSFVIFTNLYIRRYPRFSHIKVLRIIQYEATSNFLDYLFYLVVNSECLSRGSTQRMYPKCKVESKCIRYIGKIIGKLL